MSITIADEARRIVVASIKEYFMRERDEEIGDLQASFLLDFVLQEIGPSIYNQAIRDVQGLLGNVVAELDLSLSEPEFGYSAQIGARQHAGRRAGK